MMLPWGPPAQTKTSGLGREKRVPPFSDPGIQRPSLPIPGWGGPPPPLHPPPLHPRLNCEGIRICNIGLQMGVEGLLQWPLNLEEGARSRVPRWEEGRQARDGCGWKGRAVERPPCLGVESGPGRPGLEAWVQDPAGCPPGFGREHFPHSGPLSVA